MIIKSLKLEGKKMNLITIVSVRTHKHYFICLHLYSDQI